MKFTHSLTLLLATLTTSLAAPAPVADALAEAVNNRFYETRLLQHMHVQPPLQKRSAVNNRFYERLLRQHMHVQPPLQKRQWNGPNILNPEIRRKFWLKKLGIEKREPIMNNPFRLQYIPGAKGSDVGGLRQKREPFFLGNIIKCVRAPCGTEQTAEWRAKGLYP